MKNFIFIALTFTSFLKTHAFTLAYSNEAHFPSSEVIFDIAGNDCSVAGFNSQSELLSMVKEAVDEYWNRVATCDLELKEGSVRADVDISSDSSDAALAKTNDGTILIGCRDSEFTSGSLAVATIDPNRLNRGVVFINNSDTSFANLTTSQKKATLAHEIGHAFGLGHSGDPTALMYYTVGGKIQEKLTIDDFDACSYLYSHGSPGSCGTIGIDSNSGPGGGSKEGPFFINFILAIIIGVSLGLAAKGLKGLKSITRI